MVTRSPVALRLLLVVCALAAAMPGLAQTAPEPDTPEPAHVAYVDGTATITHDGRADQADINVPLVSGDRLRTQDGRVEVLFGDASVLDVDHYTSLDFLSDELLRLLEGRLRLTIAGRDRIAYRIDTPAGAVRIDTPGEYRIALLGESSRRPDVELITIRGYATLVNDLGETGVGAGARAFATASLAPSYAQAYNSAAWDAFDRWAQDRRDERTGTTSARYLPDDVRVYAASFDRYGDWRFEDTYGYVWYPRVHVQWRPYSYGRWSYYGPWGWTWIAGDPWWGWPTHHYGRWGFRAGAWFWIPARHWGPAYVYWASAPGYVGWCPLGWNGRPILNIINVNVGFGGRGYYDPYRAWTVVPRHAFASRGHVGQYAVPRHSIERAVPRWSVESAAPPVRPDTVSARANAAPIYAAGRTRVVTRGAELSGPRPLDSHGAGPSGPSREAGRRRDGMGTPRATPPAAPGVLGAPATAAPVNRARSRYPSADLGPGGREGRGQVPEARGQVPEAAGADWDGPARSRSVYGPRGLPDGGPGYAPRGVPRSAPRSYEPPSSYEPARPRERAYDRPARRNPEYSRPAPPPAAPPSADRPSRSVPTYSRPSHARPSYGPPPSAPRGGESDRPSRAVPRAGDGPSRPVPRGTRR